MFLLRVQRLFVKVMPKGHGMQRWLVLRVISADRASLVYSPFCATFDSRPRLVIGLQLQWYISKRVIDVGLEPLRTAPPRDVGWSEGCLSSKFPNYVQ